MEHKDAIAWAEAGLLYDEFLNNECQHLNTALFSVIDRFVTSFTLAAEAKLPLGNLTLTKLRAVSPGSEAGAAPDLSVDLAGQEVPARLAAAVDERRVVAFDYASASSGSLRRRVVEPHALRLSEGAWYLDGLDTRAQ